jgi:hypothetical protein
VRRKRSNSVLSTFGNSIGVLLFEWRGSVLVRKRRPAAIEFKKRARRPQGKKRESRYHDSPRMSGFSNPPAPLENFMSNTFVRLATTAVLAGVAAFALSVDSSAQISCEPGVGLVPVCPCGNNPSSLGRGCNNSGNTGGARLLVTGTPSLSSDNTLFQTFFIGSNGPSCTTFTNNLLSVLYTGTAPMTGGIPWNDGVLCCGGSLFVLNAQVSNGGMTVFPVPGTTGTSAQHAAVGDPLTAGMTRCYFVAYRDVCPTFCSPGFRQKTNSWTLTWTP